MSASMSPTRAPPCASATARFVATVDLPTPPFPRLHRVSHLAHERGRILRAEEEGEPHTAVGLDAEVADHAGGDDVGAEPGVDHPTQRRRDATDQRVRHP